MRWTRLGLIVGLVAPLAAGCKGSSPSPSPAASNTAPLAVTTTAAAPASAPSPSPPSGAACSFDRGLTGTIGPANVFVLLTRTGDDLAGTYFYEKTGGDLALKGTVTGSSFTLTESTGGKTTGTMAGTCQAGGALTGTWTSPDGKRTLPLTLSVPARITVGTRKLKFTTKRKEGDCEFNRTMPVVLGAPSAAAERRMAEAIAAAAKEVADPAHERDVRACKPDQDGFTLSYFDGGFTVASQDANVLVLQFSAGINVTPSAHPANFAGATVLDLDLATGNAVLPKDVVTDEARVVALAQQCSDTDIQLSEAEPAFILRPHGIQVVGTSYGHAIAVATFQGPELSYAALLRDGLLKPGSPIAREWAGEKAAAPGASPCRTRWKLSD